MLSGRHQFIEEIGEIVKEVAIENNYSDIMIYTCISQACIESGYGNSELMRKANALFGIKATKSWKGKVFNSKTKECYDGINLTTISSCFRAYNSIKESVEDYFNLLKNKRYNKCFEAKSVDEAITIIKNGGYATSPTYIDSVIKIYNMDKEFINTFSKDFNDEEYIEDGIDYYEIAKDVIKGKYGNGETRKMLLGKHYYRVQSIVNNIY